MTTETNKVVKKTYSLQQSLIQRFENITRKRERSKLIARLIEEWIANQEKEKLRVEIIQGCRDMSKIYSEIEKVYHPLEEEVERMQHED